jgi:hypothetical protein
MKDTSASALPGTAAAAAAGAITMLLPFVGTPTSPALPAAAPAAAAALSICVKDSAAHFA